MPIIFFPFSAQEIFPSQKFCSLLNTCYFALWQDYTTHPVNGRLATVLEEMWVEVTCAIPSESFKEPLHGSVWSLFLWDQKCPRQKLLHHLVFTWIWSKATTDPQWTDTGSRNKLCCYKLLDFWSFITV